MKVRGGRLMLVAGSTACLACVIWAVVAASDRRAGYLVAEPTEYIWKGGEDVNAIGFAKGAFVLINKGSSDVRILSMSSDCGCSKPVVDVSIVRPGKRARISVEARPLVVGEREAALNVVTDSVVSPVISLKFKMIGSAKPPYVLQLVGDLAYPDWTENEGLRTVTLITIEPEGIQYTPMLKSDLEYILFRHVDTKESVYSDGFLERKYEFNATFSGQPPDDTFAGEAYTVDPWVEGRRLAIPIQGRKQPAIRGFLSRVLLTEQHEEFEVWGFHAFLKIAPEAKGLEVNVTGLPEGYGTRVEEVSGVEGRGLRQYLVEIRKPVGGGISKHLTFVAELKDGGSGEKAQGIRIPIRQGE